MIKHRVLIFSIAMLFLFVLIMARVGQLALLQYDTLSSAATEQRVRNFDYYQYARGDIKDCQGRNLTNIYEHCLVILPAIAANYIDIIAQELSLVLDYDEKLIKDKLQLGSSQNITPFILKTGLSKQQCKNIEQMKLPGVMITEQAARYGVERIAAHIIGYVQPVGEKGKYSGVSGLEQQYDDQLANRYDKQLQTIVDANGSNGNNAVSVITNYNVKYNSLQLTINRDYQQIAEQAFSEFGYSGACVIMDPDNGDLLAVVSAPTFDPYCWEDAVGDAYVNKAFSLFAPASTFKTLLSIAALDVKANMDVAALTDGDTSAVDESDAEVFTPAAVFNCDGSYSFGDGHTVSCAGGVGHGQVDLARALALSCNCYFVALGQQLGGETIKEYADLLGLYDLTVGGYDLPSYSREDFLDFNSEHMGALANASLGEAGVNISPVQEAVLMSACVNGGFRVWPRLVSGIIDEQGKIIKETPAVSAEKVVDSNISETVRLMLIDTVENGTAAAAKGKYTTTGGKTGSSESGGVWFSGFAPADNPDFVIVVFVQNGTAGGVEAAAIFKYIVDNVVLLNGQV